MRPTLIKYFAFAVWACACTSNSYGQSLEYRRAQRDMEDALLEMDRLNISAMTDDSQITYFEGLIKGMNKSKLDAFTDLLAVCSSEQDCSPQLETYGIKFQDPKESKVLTALRAANNQYKPQTAGRRDRSAANNALHIFKSRIQASIRARYAELG